MESRESCLAADGRAWKVDGRAQALVGPSLATPLLLDITIITIVDPLLYVCMKFTKTLLNAPSAFFIVCYPLFPVLS